MAFTIKQKVSLIGCIVLIFSACYTHAQVKKIAPVKKIVPSKTKIPTKPKVANTALLKVIDNAIKVKITTDSGIIIVKLYDSTPLHRDNFVKLVKEGFYDSLLFHRVINAFMIQGGDPQSKNAPPNVMLGGGGGDMQRIPAEFKSSLIHKKGALCAARDGNAEKASSACQFYIVQGKPYTDDELNSIQANKGLQYSPLQRLTYKTIGGVPFLDNDYTVFGEVISGLRVVDKIARVQKDQADRPIGNIKMKMEIINK